MAKINIPKPRNYLFYNEISLVGLTPSVYVSRIRYERLTTKFYKKTLCGIFGKIIFFRANFEMMLHKETKYSTQQIRPQIHQLKMMIVTRS